MKKSKHKPKPIRCAVHTWKFVKTAIGTKRVCSVCKLAITEVGRNVVIPAKQKGDKKKIHTSMPSLGKAAKSL